MSVPDEPSTGNNSENHDTTGGLLQDLMMMYEYEIDCSLHDYISNDNNLHNDENNNKQYQLLSSNHCNNNNSKSHFDCYQDENVQCSRSEHQQQQQQRKRKTNDEKIDADNLSFAVASTYTSSTVANTTFVNMSLHDGSRNSNSAATKNSNPVIATTTKDKLKSYPNDRFIEEQPSMVHNSSASSSSSSSSSSSKASSCLSSSSSSSCSFGQDPGQSASYAATALALTVQDWSLLGTDVDIETSCTGDLETLVDRITSLLLVRIAAVAAVNNSIRTDQFGVEDLTNDSTEMHGWTPTARTKSSPYTDYSTSTICRTLLMQQQPWHSLTPAVTPKVIDQLRLYVHRILSGYNDVPYHNREHAFHVVLSTNKLLDMMLQPQQHSKSKPTPTYGLRQEPIQLLGLVFAALVHDVEHLGIPNRQLALESDPLAIQYNDFSIAEQRSLYIAFLELLQDDYIELRTTMFGTPNVGVESEEYRRFRTTVVNLVLITDIASPERTQLSKSKWKEAFGEKVKRTDGSTKKATATTTTTASTTQAPVTITETKENSSAVVSIQNTNVEQPQTMLTVPSHEDSEPMSPPLRTLNRERSRTESSDDEYTIPITPDMSECNVDDLDYNDDDDADDGVIFHSSIKPLGTSSSNNVPNVTTSPTNKRIHQSQLDKLEYLIRLSTRKTSIGGLNWGTESFHGTSGDDYERQTLYGTNHNSNNKFYEPAVREGRRIQKSSSLPGKLNPPIPVIEFEQYHVSTAIYPRQRQMSAPHCITSFRKRLGIRRSMDLSGEALETYNRNRHLIYNHASTGNHVFPKSTDNTALYYDQPDELKASVVLELILTAADVAHNLQGWEQMVKWSGRLYMELRKAFVNHRSSFDPKTRWYENQIGFLESYLIPLAQCLLDTGVFNNSGVNFVEVVKNNRDQWIRDGATITETIILAGDDRFPLQPKVLSPVTTNASSVTIITKTEKTEEPVNEVRPSPTRGLCKSYSLKHCTPSVQPATLSDSDDSHSNTLTTMEITENVIEMISHEETEVCCETTELDSKLQKNSGPELVTSNSSAPIETKATRRKKSKKSKDQNEVLAAMVGFFESRRDEVQLQHNVNNPHQTIVKTPVESHHVVTPLPNYFGYLLTEICILVMVVIICVLVVSDVSTPSICSEMDKSF